MDKPQWYGDMQSAVGNLFDEHARQAEVETQAQAGLLESEGGETDAGSTIMVPLGKVWTVPYCLRMWKRYPEIMSFDDTYNTNRFKLQVFQIITDYDQAMKEALDSQYPEMPATVMYPPYQRKRSS
ncbi:unnamed protein product [Clonostachys rhizophaga]|uniref:Uncharacterized protein n=1 Tax=Clonostachys rhizophaga TaxID=160324 RepID=A0A9N9VCF7_9HYPO|nr:unnamed protein product [Clonostachys rhizophaga]